MCFATFSLNPIYCTKSAVIEITFRARDVKTGSLNSPHCSEPLLQQFVRIYKNVALPICSKCLSRISGSLM
ncbi:hypothetical protein OIDMADRAFT_15939 [Oidiodendron maius Zn]|uniref:Uncharacterized protein n=1 Tax=Oidiodendron maius (strain Zn) TaxID=913774 RepID=A0A0C3D6A1_OIDMZ|nr:hypothetical protein OIDMADRAFT_15939 [Oidiodendron maius Zn]